MLLASAPALAQDNLSAAAPTSSAPTSDIGPRELSNFSLNGTVTREAQPQTQAPVRQPAAETASPPAPRASNPPAASTERNAPVRTAGSATHPVATPTGSVLDAPPTRADVPPATMPSPAAPPPVAASTAAALPAQASGFSPLPWIAALLLLAAGAAVYFALQRRGRRFETAGVSHHFDAAPEPQPAPAPAPIPRQPAAEPLVRRPAPEASGVVTSNLRPAMPAAAAAPAVPAGIVSSLRPWIELELEPSQATLTDDHAAIAFDVTIFNSGSAPARDVAVEACMINAGDQQDVQLGEFYTAPSKVRDKIPAVAPMARVTLKSAVRLPRASVREYEVEGRKLFMPMVAVNSRYRWSSGEGQSGASFLVGGRAANDSEKLAPLRLDRGKRGWKALAARRYEKGVRS